MALIKETQLLQHDSNFLLKYGFTFGEDKGPQGECGYTNTYFHSNNTERLWVTVDFENGIVYFYNEYECGGLLSQWTEDIPDNVKYCEYPFIEWLNEQIPEEMSN